MVTAIWSDDPEFYMAMLGDDDLLYHTFVKVNYTDTNMIIQRFNLSAIAKNIFTRSDEHKYICVTAENAKIAIEAVKETKEAMKSA